METKTTDCPGICQLSGRRCPPECNTTYQPCSKARGAKLTIGRPVITGWSEAYNVWLPGALLDGHTNVNDAFRAGYLAGIRDIKEFPDAD